MSDFNVDELFPDTKPVKPLKPAKRPKSDPMKATAAQLGVTNPEAVSIKGGEFQGYDYGSGTLISSTALSPSVKHFEDLHQVASDLENHIADHEAYTASNDMHPDDRSVANGHIASAWNALALFSNTNSKAMLAHIKGAKAISSVSEQSPDHTIEGAADHLHTSVLALRNAYATHGLQPHPIITNIAQKASDIVSSYKADNNQQITPRASSIIERGKAVASYRGIPGTRQLPLLDPKEAEAQSAASAERRATSGKTVVVGKPMTFMGRSEREDSQTPVGPGEVRTPSGGAAPQADVAKVQQKLQSRQEEYGKAERMSADIMKESRKPASGPAALKPASFTSEYSPISPTAEGSNPERDSSGATRVESFRQSYVPSPSGRLIDPETSRDRSPVSRFAAEQLDRAAKPSVVEPSRLAAFRAQQDSAKEFPTPIDNKIAAVEFRQNLRKTTDDRVRSKMIEHINAGNFGAAADHHAKTAKYRTQASSQKAILAANTNPIGYLKKQGFDVQETTPQTARETVVRNKGRRATAGNLETRRPTTATVSPFTPQAETSYRNNLAVADAAESTKSSRAARNNSAFKGE